MRNLFCVVVLVFAVCNLAFSQRLGQRLFADEANATGLNRSAEAGFAEEEFRRGVQSYYRGYFNEAIIQFEKALSYLPDESLILDWLGKAYYRSGLDGSAIEHWQFASDAGYGGILLENKIELLRERRLGSSIEQGFLDADRTVYTETGSYSGTNRRGGGAYQVFNSPSCVLPNSDGTVWIVSYGSNEILLLDINGNVVRRVTGPINGFDRPLDLIKSVDGGLLLSESAGDRIAVLNESGGFVRYIGQKGRGEGQFISPQYMAQDALGNIYVTDFGNARVAVFDKDGNGLFSFGQRSAVLRGSEGFAGLRGPTGIAIIGERVLVADSFTGGIYEFDLSGNYLGIFVPERTFSFPEALKFGNNGKSLIACDRNRIYSIDLASGAVFEAAYTGNAPARLTCAVPDFNGNLLAADFKNSEVYIMSKMSELLGGLYIEISRVNSERFPRVTVEVSVQNRMRQAVTGLRPENFYITEGRRAVSNLKFEGAAFSNTKEDIVLIVDRSIDTALHGNALNHAVREIAASMQGVGNIFVVSSGEVPVLEYSGAPSGLLNFSHTALRAQRSEAAAFDLALRMAANNLINAEPKRAIIYLTVGALSQNAFDKYGLSDLASYLNNNSIAFSIVQLSQGAVAEEFNYICERTYGQGYYVFRPEGLSGVIQDLLAIPVGLYRFTYDSALNTDMGRSYLPIEVETYIMNRSGRDESGYFAPLE